MGVPPNYPPGTPSRDPKFGVPKRGSETGPETTPKLPPGTPSREGVPGG